MLQVVPARGITSELRVGDDGHLNGAPHSQPTHSTAVLVVDE
jgi:hypothetical protein